MEKVQKKHFLKFYTIHIYIEMSQGNSCVAILSKGKCHFFPFTKLESRSVEEVLPGVGVGTTRSGRKWEQGMGGRIWCKYCVHMCVSGKMRPVETIT
jgi:hypothetical protein